VKGNEKTRLLSAKVSGEVINGLVFDITERKQTEEELRNANSYLENLINYANAPIIVWDPQFRITRFNHAFENLTGLKESDVLGKSIEILFAAAAKDNSMELIRKTQSGERWETVEIEIQHCDGSLQTVLWNSATLFGPDDKTPIATIAQGQEITRRKKAEEELKQFSTRLSLATRAGGVGVWDWELSNNTLLWDDQMFVLYGASRESFSGAYSAWQAGLHPDDKVRCDEEIQKALKGEKEFNTEFRVVWPDGSIHFIRALAFVQRDEAGKALRMIGTNWDITKQKESEAEIKHKNEQLEKLNSEKDKFFSIIAHDLRGPFNGFLGLTQIMAEQFKSLTLTQLQEISMGLNKSAKNLFSLLNNLLEWSRMQRGTISFEPTAIPLLSFTTYALNPVMEPALKKGVAINIDIAETINVFADENMLSSIIRNLTTNAVKFTLKGGKVSLSAKTTADGYIEFSVQDTGIGMDAEIMDNMFKLDVSISRKGTEGEPSTGLGLFLCKDFIEKHGGRIWAESEEGKGSIFSFVIPKTH
jgi:PAS domain S-box-containing protein